MSESQEYKVNLDVYSGPLELLLYLIRKEEVDIRDIPISHITRQYLKHVEIIRQIDINLAGEFLVMAATLMEIKSRMLIPRPVPVVNPEDPGASASMEDLADPRTELVRQLLAYKQFKDAAGELKRRAHTEAERYPRATPRTEGRAPLDIEDLNLFALIDAFGAIMASIGHTAYGHEVVYDDTPISLHQADILDRLQRLEEQGAAGGGGGEHRGGLTLQALFAGRTTKNELIGLFLATLELIKLKKVYVEQLEPLGELRIMLRTDSVAQETAAAALAAAQGMGGGGAGEAASLVVPAETIPSVPPDQEAGVMPAEPE